MANTLIEFDYYEGCTLTADVFPIKSDTAGATGKSATEQTNRKGKYRITVSEALTGVNEVRVKEGGLFVAAYSTEALVDDTNVYEANERLAYLNGASTAMVNTFADQVWDEALSGHTTSGSAGKHLSDTSSDVFSLVSMLTGLVAKFTGITLLAQWLGAMSGKQTPNSTALTEMRATGAGSGTYDPAFDSPEAQRDNVGTAGAGLTAADDGVISAIGALHNLSSAEAQAAAAAALVAYGAATQTSVDDAQEDIDTLLSDHVDIVSMLSGLSAALVVVDGIVDQILAADTAVLPEIASESDIPATPTPRQAAMLRYMLDRNATQATATLRKLLNNAGSTVLQAPMSDNGTTFTQGKLGNP